MSRHYHWTNHQTLKHDSLTLSHLWLYFHVQYVMHLVGSMVSEAFAIAMASKTLNPNVPVKALSLVIGPSPQASITYAKTPQLMRIVA